jgi:hypothetical protein
MRKYVGLALSLVLAISVFAAAPVAASDNNNAGATDTERGIACQVSLDGIVGMTEDVLNRWKGDESELVCKFKDLDVSGYTGADPLPTTIEGFRCTIAPNPYDPGQPGIVTTDTSFKVNAQGNGTLRCSGTQVE